MSAGMREWADFTVEDRPQAGADSSGPTLALRGPLRVYSIGDLDRRLEASHAQFKRVDLAGVTDIDTAGAWLVHRWSSQNDAPIDNASEQARRLIGAVSHGVTDKVAPPERPALGARVLGGIGLIVSNWGRGALDILDFFGALLSSVGGIVRHPQRLRHKALVRQLELVGIDSLGIVGLMSFLIGIVIAQQGAVQLEQFGASIYTINLTGRLALRELGILMTAIMVAGRSGSAFAAQIGTMRLTEEVDAMRTIGVSPMEALVVPRVFASVLMLPLLGFYASVMAIVGGAFISTFSLDIPFFTFLDRIKEVVPLTDVWVGLIKGPVFGLIVGLTGCYQGMQVKGNAEEVGARTTQAVVTAIFSVIVMDAFFAVFFTKVGWA